MFFFKNVYVISFFIKMTLKISLFGLAYFDDIVVQQIYL